MAGKTKSGTATPTPPGAGKIIAPTGFGGWDTWDIARGVVVDSAPALVDALRDLVAGEPLVAAGAGAVVFYPIGVDWPTKQQDAEHVWNCREFLVVPEVWTSDTHGRTPANLPAVAAAIAIATQTGDMNTAAARVVVYQGAHWSDANNAMSAALRSESDALEVTNATIANAIVAGAEAAEVVRQIAGIAAGFDCVPGTPFPPHGLSWIMPVQTWRAFARRAAALGLVQSGRISDVAAGFLGGLAAVVRVRSSGLGVDQVFDNAVGIGLTSAPFFGANRVLYLAFGPGGRGPIVQVASDRPTRFVVSVSWVGATEAFLIDDVDELPFGESFAAAEANFDAVRVAKAFAIALEVAEFKNALAIAFDRAAALASPADARLVDTGDMVVAALGLVWAPKPVRKPTPAIVDPTTGAAAYLSPDVVQDVDFQVAGPYGRAGALDALVEAVTGDPAPWRGRSPIIGEALGVAAAALDARGDRSLECRGHPSDPEDGLARTVYCDGSCRPA